MTEEEDKAKADAEAKEKAAAEEKQKLEDEAVAKKKEEEEAEKAAVAKKKEEEEKPSSDSPIDRAENVLKNITEQNDRFEKNIEALKKAQADDLLGGRSLAGKQQTDEEKTKEASRAILPDGMDPFEPPAE